MTYRNFYFHGAHAEGDAYFKAMDDERLRQEEIAAACERQGLVQDATDEEG